MNVFVGFNQTKDIEIVDPNPHWGTYSWYAAEWIYWVEPLFLIKNQSFIYIVGFLGRMAMLYGQDWKMCHCCNGNGALKYMHSMLWGHL